MSLQVLRPITEYVRTAKGVYRKKKAWDGVTGTIFNLQSQPLQPSAEIEDKRKQRIKDIYWDPFRDNCRGRETKIFPLDIRRVLKVTPGVEKPRYIYYPGEEHVRYPTLYPDKRYSNMNPDDPWYATDAQTLVRDAPPRHNPPRQVEFSGNHLPLDNQLWKEEYLRLKQER